MENNFFSNFHIIHRLQYISVFNFFSQSQLLNFFFKTKVNIQTNLKTKRNPGY